MKFDNMNYIMNHNFPGHPYVSDQGRLKYHNGNDILIRNALGTKIVVLNGKLFSLCNIMLSTFYGECVAPFTFKDGDKLNITADNLQIIVDAKRISKNEIEINGTSFIAYPSKPRYYVSKRGTIYDLVQNAIVRRLYYTDSTDIGLVHLAGLCPSIEEVVYETYCGPLEPGWIVQFLDGNPMNYTYTNLEAVKRTVGRPSVHTWSKLEVETVCKLLSEGASNATILQQLHLSNAQPIRQSLNILIRKLRHENLYPEITAKYDINQIRLRTLGEKGSTTIESIRLQAIVI